MQAVQSSIAVLPDHSENNQ